MQNIFSYVDSRKEEYCMHNNSTRVEKGTINYGLYSIEKNQLYTRYSSLVMIKWFKAKQVHWKKTKKCTIFRTKKKLKVFWWKNKKNKKKHLYFIHEKNNTNESIIVKRKRFYYYITDTFFEISSLKKNILAFHPQPQLQSTINWLAEPL